MRVTDTRRSGCRRSRVAAGHTVRVTRTSVGICGCLGCDGCSKQHFQHPTYRPDPPSEADPDRGRADRPTRLRPRPRPRPTCGSGAADRPTLLASRVCAGTHNLPRALRKSGKVVDSHAVVATRLRTWTSLHQPPHGSKVLRYAYRVAGARGRPHCHTYTCTMWVPDLGLALRVCPGMTQSSGADLARPPGFLPAPCGGHGPRKAGFTSPARWA